MAFSGEDVAHYYDVNTPGFLSLGEGGSVGAIHRAVWGDNVRSREAAFHYVDSLVLRELSKISRSQPRLLDLGCGVGASLDYLLQHSEAVGFGISNSKVQLSLAEEGAGRRFGARLSLLLGDFCHDPLPSDLDLAFGIESFVQGSDPRRFFENVALSIRSGGRLVLCDDFLKGDEASLTAKQKRMVSQFRRGWRLSSLLTLSKVDALAESVGLELIEDRDLSSQLKLDRPRDYGVQAAAALLGRLRWQHPRLLNLIGGNALRTCLKGGLVSYRYRVWRKR